MLLLAVGLVSELDDELEEDGDVDDPDDDEEVEAEAGGEFVVDELVLESLLAASKIFASGESGAKFSIAAKKKKKSKKKKKKKKIKRKRKKKKKLNK